MGTNDFKTLLIHKIRKQIKDYKKKYGCNCEEYHYLKGMGDVLKIIIETDVESEGINERI